jgi:hypothetical protein
MCAVPLTATSSRSVRGFKMLLNPSTPELNPFRATLPAEIFYWGF